MAPGSELVVNRLADMLFIHSIRAHIGSQSETCKGGLLRAIFDPQIGVALKSMHERVDHPWTVGIAGGSLRYVAFRFCGSL